MHRHGVAGLRLGALAELEVGDHQPLVELLARQRLAIERGQRLRGRQRRREAQQLDGEDQRRVRRDLPGAALRVAELRRDHQLALAADLHARDALVPALDHPARAQLKAERPIARARRVEHRAVGQVPGVVDLDVAALHRLGALADHVVGHRDLPRRLAGRHGRAVEGRVELDVRARLERQRRRGRRRRRGGLRRHLDLLGHLGGLRLLLGLRLGRRTCGGEHELDAQEGGKRNRRAEQHGAPYTRIPGRAHPRLTPQSTSRTAKPPPRRHAGVPGPRA